MTQISYRDDEGPSFRHQAEQAFTGVWREFAEQLPAEDEADDMFPTRPEETAEEALQQLRTGMWAVYRKSVHVPRTMLQRGSGSL